MREAGGWHLSLRREVSPSEWDRESIPGSPCSWLRTEEIARAPALRAATLRSAQPPLLFPELRRRAASSAHARAGRGRPGGGFPAPPPAAPARSIRALPN